MRFGKLHCLRACQYLEVADVYRAGKRLDTGSSVRIIRVYARIQEAFFPFRRGTAKDNPYRTEIQTPACHARHVPVHVLHICCTNKYYSVNQKLTLCF